MVEPGASGATYRLPTEEEWGRAAAGSQPGCYRERTGNLGTCPVGSYGANEVDLSDIVGNVWEWTEACSEEGCGRRVMRGGSWDFDGQTLWRGARYGYLADSRYYDVGFRVARTLD